MEQQEELLCGIDGDDNAGVTVSQFNRWVARAIRSHVQPMKTDLAEVKEFNAEMRIIHAKIQGGVKILIWIVPVGNLLLLFVLYLMGKAGIF